MFDLESILNSSTVEMENSLYSNLEIKQEIQNANDNQYENDQEDLENIAEQEKIDNINENDSKHDVQSHIEELSNEVLKPFKCSQCSARFTKKRSIKVHIDSVHEGRRPFECKICQATFKGRGGLKFHTESIHEGKKPFVCSICTSLYITSAFARKGDLKRHIEAVHGGKKRERGSVERKVSIEKQIFSTNFGIKKEPIEETYDFQAGVVKGFVKFRIKLRSEKAF